MKEKGRSRGGAVIFSATKRIIVLIIICTITIAIFFARELLSDKKSEYVNKINEVEKLEMAIKDEEDKAEKLKKNDNKAFGDEEMESLARSELGLIKRDEIVIKPN
jgi:cell division protein FtsB